MEQTTEIQELSLEKVIDSKLVQANVTEQVLLALKQKFGGLKLKAIDDKESYLEVKQAARECAKVRTLTQKLCKEGRDEALKTQKKWISKEKEIIGKIAEVEDALDDEIKRFDDNVARIAAEEKERQEAAYINRQSTLIKMGATYESGSFLLGETSIDASLVKETDEDIWSSTIVPKFVAEYDKIEAIKVAENKRKEEEEAKIRLEQEKFRAEQESFRLQQEEFKKKQEEILQIERDKVQAELVEKQRIEREAQFEKMKKEAAEAAEQKRLADIELAVKKEKERAEFEALKAEELRKQEDQRKAEELAQSSDKVKWENFITQVSEIEVFEMRSGQYRKKMQIAKEKIEEILSL